MGDSGNVVFENTGPSGDNSAAYGNFEVGSPFLQFLSIGARDVRIRLKKLKIPQEKLKEMLKFFTTC